MIYLLTSARLTKGDNPSSTPVDRHTFTRLGDVCLDHCLKPRYATKCWFNFDPCELLRFRMASKLSKHKFVGFVERNGVSGICFLPVHMLRESVRFSSSATIGVSTIIYFLLGVSIEQYSTCWVLFQIRLILDGYCHIINTT